MTPLDVPLGTPRLRLVPLTPALADAALQGRALAGGLVAADDWPTDDAAVVLSRTCVAGVAGGQWLIARRAGLVVGECGVRSWTTAGEPEVGYGLAPSARGRGLATEAVGRLVAHLLAVPGVSAVVADAEPGNAASLRLLHRLGFATGPGPGGPDPAEGTLTHRRARGA